MRDGLHLGGDSVKQCLQLIIVCILIGGGVDELRWHCTSGRRFRSRL